MLVGLLRLVASLDQRCPRLVGVQPSPNYWFHGSLLAAPDPVSDSWEDGADNREATAERWVSLMPRTTSLSMLIRTGTLDPRVVQI